MSRCIHCTITGEVSSSAAGRVSFIAFNLACIGVLNVRSATENLTMHSDNWVLYVKTKTWADAIVLLLQLLIASSTAVAHKDVDEQEYSKHSLYSSVPESVRTGTSLRLCVP